MEHKYNKTSISDTDNFKNFCKKSSTDDLVFSTFKQNPIFTEILEHTTYQQGLDYISEINKNTKIEMSLIEKFKGNDLQGSPTLYEYVSPYGSISASTIRYIKILNDLILNFGSLDDMKIIEIGCGYGGQSKIIQDQFKPKKYSFVDLPEVNLLIEKYLSKFQYTNLEFLDFKNLPTQSYDLVISNYAFTECTIELQDLYLEKIIKQSKHGYIIGNDIGEHFGIRNYKKEDLKKIIPNSEIFEELPKTHQNNYLLVF